MNRNLAAPLEQENIPAQAVRARVASVIKLLTVKQKTVFFSHLFSAPL
jgi:ABC-type methionine transport system ATPase subunit